MTVDMLYVKTRHDRRHGPIVQYSIEWDDADTRRSHAGDIECCACNEVAALRLLPCRHRALCGVCAGRGLWTDRTTNAPLCPTCRGEVVEMLDEVAGMTVPPPARPSDDVE